MIDNFDDLKREWRYMKQDRYLFNVSLIYGKYEPSIGNDHDHCEFCGEKFFQRDGFLHEGYCTPDKYRWICKNCFNDFKIMFQWNVTKKEN